MSVDVSTSTEWVGQIPVVHLCGVLDARSYLHVRNAIVKAATDGPKAVVVVIDHLVASSPSAWTVLTSASWLIRQWPGIPLLAVSSSPGRKTELTRNAITRYVPLHATLDDALAAVDIDRHDEGTRLRVRHHRPRSGSALVQMRDLVTDTFEGWGLPECVPAARCIVSVLSGNVLQHTDSDLDLRIEVIGQQIKFAMSDDSDAPAVLREAAATNNVYVSGLAILAALSHSWGSAPTGNGKTVWAVLGPEQYLSMYR
ncbi:sulfate transporter [Rhodococcoides kyotonense]|uniref:STAS domain-containing protein n=1 Tax=Rhodococcoides kyotonense TaxID=398843 RepID=A0A239J5G7_9NOCA|nr:sulfate transporter [Rhodococcus kyotonensis]SNT01039.1 hypothetical protein SAMN05421642_10858 [Rhodococcus kyotonensis]